MWIKYTRPVYSGHRVFGVPSGLVGAGNGDGQPAGTSQEGSNFVVCAAAAVVVVDISFAIHVACTCDGKKSPLGGGKKSG